MAAKANLRWAPIKDVPITQALYSHLRKHKLFRRTSPSAGLVGEKACDDIIQRLSPYLRRNPPLDIIDLWPQCGVFSSKLNNFLKPRRHILIEPDLDAYRPFLVPLANSKPCYTLLSEYIYKMREWDEFFRKYLPEQSDANKSPEGALLPRNDSLLLLANPAIPMTKKDHNTPARWWAAIVESCLRQTDLNRYGSIRIIAGLPLDEVQSVLPRQLADRARPALLTEGIALHAMDIATTNHQDPCITLKRWDSIHRNIQRAEERREASGIVTPVGREVPQIACAPPTPVLTRARLNGIDGPHQSRAHTESHTRWVKEIETHKELAAALGSEHAKTKAARSKASRATASFRRENQMWITRQKVVDMQIQIDRKMRELSRAAADPTRTAAELKIIDDEIARMTKEIADEKSSTHFRTLQSFSRFIDDARSEDLMNGLDDSVLPWDRRPFNPLQLRKEDVYPYEPRSFIYFEADTNPIAAQYLQRVPEDRRERLLQLFDGLTFAGTGAPLTIQSLANTIFPGRSINDLVKTIPLLATFANKRLKPGHGPAPLTDPTVDPTKTFQDNIDYDFSDVCIQSTPVSVMWEIALEYQASSSDLSAIQFTRLLGGTMTTFRDGQYLAEARPKR